MKEYKFPTVHREAQYHEEPVSIEFEGEKWVVGEQALRHKRGCSYIRDVEELVHYYPLYLLEVKRREGIGNGAKVAVSLPLDVYVVEKRKKEQGKKNFIEGIQKRCSAYRFAVSVAPQGIAGLQHLISEKKVKDDTYTLLIDGGFNTVNVAVVNPELRVDFFKTFTDEVGVRNLIEDFFAEELRKRFPAVSTNLVVLKEIFIKGLVDTGLKVEDIRPEKEKALQRYKNRLFRRILGELKRAGIDYDQIVFMGGLSYYLSKKESFETNKQLYIPEEGGEFLNVKGLYDYVGNVELAVDLGFGDTKVLIGEQK